MRWGRIRFIAVNPFLKKRRLGRRRRILPYEETKKNMKAVLADIQDGVFAGKWIAENKNGRMTPPLAPPMPAA